jgi:peptidoglycan/LPS O-acetylase OafA/YrhL
LLEQERRVILERFLATFLLGNVTVSLAFAMSGYVLVWWLARRYRTRRKAAFANRAIEETP